MKKILAIIISSAIVLCIMIGITCVLVDNYNKRELTLEVSTTTGGYVKVEYGKVSEIHTNISIPTTYKIQSNKEVTLTACEQTGYKFDGWTFGSEEKTDSKIKFKLENKTLVKANFSVKSVQLTVTDSEESFSEQFQYNLTTNLLDILNNKYTAQNGYYYEYSINGQIIDSISTISDDATIVRTKKLLTYTVSFIQEDETVVERTYTIENKNIEEPAVNEKEGYLGKWEDYNLDSLTNITVNAEYDLIVYTVTFKTSENDANPIIVEYTIEDKNITEPSTDNVPAKEGYDIQGWGTYNLDNLENITVYPAYKLITYTVTFKADENDPNPIVEEYTIEDKNITEPALPKKENNICIGWESYSLDVLGDKTVYAEFISVENSKDFSIVVNFKNNSGAGYNPSWPQCFDYKLACDFDKQILVVYNDDKDGNPEKVSFTTMIKTQISTGTLKSINGIDVNQSNFDDVYIEQMGKIYYEEIDTLELIYG